MAHQTPRELSQQQRPAGLQRTSSFRHAVQRASARLHVWTHPSSKQTTPVDAPPVPRPVRQPTVKNSQPRPRPVSTCQPSVVLQSKRSSNTPRNFLPELVTVIATENEAQAPSSPVAKDACLAESAVEDMLNAAIRASSKLENFATRSKRLRLLDSAGSMRIRNTREDLGRPLSSKDAVQRRLLFVCASMSLAADFHEFQRRQARKHRKNAPDSPSSPGGMLSGAKKRALNDFVAAQAPIDTRERTELETAVLLGTKAQIVNAIGQSLRLGNSLGLLCAFEARQLSELSYQRFPELRMLLKDNAAATAHIRSFSTTVDTWWSKQLEDYHHHFTSIRSRSNTKASPMMSADLSKSPKLGRPSRPTVEVQAVDETEAQRKRSASDAVSPSGSPSRRVSVRSSSGRSRLSLDKPLPPIAPAPALPTKSKLRQFTPSTVVLDGNTPPPNTDGETGTQEVRYELSSETEEDQTRQEESGTVATNITDSKGTLFFETDEDDETIANKDTDEAEKERRTSEQATSQSPEQAPTNVQLSPNAETRVDDLLQELETSSMWHNTPVSIGIGPLPAVDAVK